MRIGGCMLYKVVSTVVFWSLSCLIPTFSLASGLNVESELAPMNVPRYNASSVQHDGKIYVFGGIDSNKHILDKVEVYDPAQDIWTELTPLPTARAASCAEVIGDKIYVLGGGQGTGNGLSSNVVYDQDTDTWSEAAPMPTGRYGASSFIYEEKIIVIGGETSIYQPTHAVEIFDPQTNTWSTGAPMPTARGALTSIAEYQQELYILSGYLSSDTYTKAFEKYNPETDSWTVLDDTPYGFRQADTQVIGNVIYCLGGNGKNDSPNQWPELLLYDISNSTWQSAGLSNFQKRKSASSQVIGDKLYVLGGRSADNTIPANQLLTINQPAIDALILTDASSVKCMDLESHAILWAADLPGAYTEYLCFVLADGQGGNNVIVTDRNGYTACFNGQSGQQLWTAEGFVFRRSYAAEFLHKQVYEEGSLLYPDGPPNMGGGPAPDILLDNNAGTIRLVDGLSGETVWEHTSTAPYNLIRPDHFLPDIDADGLYDVVIKDKSNGIYCLSGANGTSVLWERQDLVRGGDPVPDINGDGQADFVVNDCCWKDTLSMLDGATGATLWSTRYGSFDLHFGLPVQDDVGLGLIQSAQLASGGGTRRYTATDGEIVWELPGAYSDMASCGLLQSTKGLNHVALWRHQDRYVCMNVQNGTVLWDTIPCEGSQREGIIAVPDCTGDGGEDIVALDNGIPKIYDGLSAESLETLPATQVRDCAVLIGKNPAHDPDRLKWRYATKGSITSSPAIGKDGTIFVGSDDNSLYALHANGTLKWEYQIGSHIWSSPAIDKDGVIYFGSYMDDSLYALYPDGTLKWRYETDSYIIPSPAIAHDGSVYIGSDDDKLYAINPDGSLKWSNDTGNDLDDSSPSIRSDGTISIGSQNGHIYAVNPNGTLKWSYQAGDSIDSSPAIGQEGTLFVGSLDTNLYALSPDGSLKWKFNTDGRIISSPAIGSNGTIYVGSEDDHLYAINANGSLQWKFQTGDNILSSPAVGRDGTIYVGSDDNTLYAFNTNGSVRWTYQTGGNIVSSPTLGHNGTIYVGSEDKHLYALNGQTGGVGDTPWPMFRHNAQHTGQTLDSSAIPFQSYIGFLYEIQSGKGGSIIADESLADECIDVSVLNDLRLPSCNGTLQYASWGYFTPDVPSENHRLPIYISADRQSDIFNVNILYHDSISKWAGNVQWNAPLINEIIPDDDNDTHHLLAIKSAMADTMAMDFRGIYILNDSEAASELHIEQNGSNIQLTGGGKSLSGRVIHTTCYAIEDTPNNGTLYVIEKNENGTIQGYRVWDTGSEPFGFDSFTGMHTGDADGDGLPDQWEWAHFHGLESSHGSNDCDNDGLTDAREYALGTDPRNKDSDGDGYTDGSEVGHPLDNSTYPVVYCTQQECDAALKSLNATKNEEIAHLKTILHDHNATLADLRSKLKTWDVNGNNVLDFGDVIHALQALSGLN